MTGLSRRAWLKLAATSVLLPLFARSTCSPMTARADGRARTRLILLMQSNGVSRRGFFPDPATGASAILEPILSSARLRSRTVVVKGVSLAGGGAGNEHDHGYAGLYSGYRTVGTFEDPWGNGPSIDQVLAGRMSFDVPIPTLNCGVMATGSPPFKDHRGSFSYLGPRRQIPTERDPYKLYRRFFSPRSSPEEAARRLAERRSVLDHGVRDLARLRGRLGAAEREKLDLHESAIRAYERQLERLDALACGTHEPATAGLDVGAEDNVPALMDMMMDFVVLALSCGLTQIVTFPLSHAGERWRYRWLGMDIDSHDDLAHKDDGLDDDVTARLVRIDRWYAERVARFALALDAIPEGEGTMLDNTILVWGNEMANGQHGVQDLPLVLLGRPRATSGRLLVDEGKQPHHRLGCSLMDAMGAPQPGFGESPTCGLLQGVRF